MYSINLGKSNLKVPTIAVGCMRLTELDQKEAAEFLHGAIELGANYFDHADIYGAGACESLFADALELNASNREKLFIQSKSSIVPGQRFDFSKEYILESVDGILSRLKTDYLDAYLLHRPDALMEPEEVAEAFDILERNGKVRHFGVSNQNPMQIQLLQKCVEQPIVANQLQFGPAHTGMIAQGIEVNMTTPGSVNHDGSVLDFCHLHDITVQPWSPFQYGFFDGVFLGNEKYKKLNDTLDALAEKYAVSATTITVAWFLRHPAKLQPIIGSTKLSRLEEACKATEVHLTRQEWYDIYTAGGRILP